MSSRQSNPMLTMVSNEQEENQLGSDDAAVSVE
jgi:hypothetical protein